MNVQALSQGTDPEAFTLARRGVRTLLEGSEAFRAMPPETQREIARNTVEVASYLAAPEGIKGHTLPNVSVRPQGDGHDPYALQQAGVATTARQRGTNTNAEGQFVAQGAREGAAVAGALLQAIDFPTFVSGLISGVFHSIVQSSIAQMEAYGRLVADVAKTINQFRDENVSVNQGRDHLVDQFPDLFTLDVDTGADGAGPRVRLRDDADEESALRRVNELPVEGGPLSSLDDETIEERLVPAARTQLATSRQQLLATMVLMGINRIVVTDGKIHAKVLYDFQARDNFRFQRSATQFDYAKDEQGNLQRMHTWEGESEVDAQGSDRSRSYNEKGGLQSTEDRGGSYYAKGKYKYTQQPVVTMVSASQQTTDASLQTKASLAGVVEVNFKSDYFPLEKMADSFQIGMIQDASRPGQARPSGRAPGGGAGSPVPPAAGQPPAPANQPAPARA